MPTIFLLLLQTKFGFDSSVSGQIYDIFWHSCISYHSWAAGYTTSERCASDIDKLRTISGSIENGIDDNPRNCIIIFCGKRILSATLGGKVARGGDQDEGAFKTVGRSGVADFIAQIAASEIIDCGLSTLGSVIFKRIDHVGFRKVKARRKIAFKIIGKEVAYVNIAYHHTRTRQNIYIPTAGKSLYIGIERTPDSVGQNTFEIVTGGVERFSDTYGIGDAAHSHGDIVVGMKIVIPHRINARTAVSGSPSSIMSAARHRKQSAKQAAIQRFPI